jgi:hypothetical protein
MLLWKQPTRNKMQPIWIKADRGLINLAKFDALRIKGSGLHQQVQAFRYNDASPGESSVTFYEGADSQRVFEAVCIHIKHGQPFIDVTGGFVTLGGKTDAT